MKLNYASIITSIVTLTGCSSFSATINKVDDAGAGTASVTGGQSGTVTSTGGSATGGGATPGTQTGGMQSNASATGIGGTASSSSSTMGGTSATNTATAAGGTQVAGGATATGASSACAKDADCTNPDPVNCSYTCVNPGTSGTCKAAALVGPTQCINSNCDDKPISGFWDANGKPHIAYAWTETDGTASIRMQQLKLDGTADGDAVAYKLPAGYAEPTILSTNAQGSKVGILWYGVDTSTSAHVVDFAITDTIGTPALGSEVERDNSNSRAGVQRISLQVTPAQAWLAIEGWFVSAAADGLSAASGSTIAAWSTLSPAVYGAEGAAGVVGSTLMLTGSDCNSCLSTFELQRYSAANLSATGSFILLSQNPQGATPAMGPVSGAMALLWTESQSPGQLFRTLINEDGTFLLAVGTVQSATQPKAVVRSASGGALLIGTILSETPTMYQLVEQRLDSNLRLVGNPLPFADSENVDATAFETHLSSDASQVLVTYRQVGAKYRLLSTDSCE